MFVIIIIIIIIHSFWQKCSRFMTSVKESPAHFRSTDTKTQKPAVYQGVYTFSVHSKLQLIKVQDRTSFPVKQNILDKQSCVSSESRAFLRFHSCHTADAGLPTPRFCFAASSGLHWIAWMHMELYSRCVYPMLRALPPNWQQAASWGKWENFLKLSRTTLQRQRNDDRSPQSVERSCRTTWKQQQQQLHREQ